MGRTGSKLWKLDQLEVGSAHDRNLDQQRYVRLRTEKCASRSASRRSQWQSCYFGLRCGDEQKRVNDKLNPERRGADVGGRCQRDASSRW